MTEFRLVECFVPRVGVAFSGLNIPTLPGLVFDPTLSTSVVIHTLREASEDSVLFEIPQ